MSYRVLITGSRSWDDISYIRNVFKEVSTQEDDIHLVSGACPQGADRLGEIVAQELGWSIETYPANWNQYGKSAGFVRNSEMVETSPDLVVGFIRNGSKGASMTANLAKKRGLWTVTHNWVDYPYTNFVIREFNAPDSPDDNEDSSDNILF